MERFHLDAAAWFRSDEAVPHLAAVSDAVWEGRRLAIDYDRGEGPQERVLDPLGLVLKAGVWYLVAMAGDQIRTYRLVAGGRRPSPGRARRPPGRVRPGHLLGGVLGGLRA